MATKVKEERTSRMVVRAVVLRKATTYNGVPGVVGGYIPWSANLERLIGLGYVGKQKVNEADLMPCPYHGDLAFLGDALLQKHVAEDEKLIETLRASIPMLEEKAVRLDASREAISPADYPLMQDAGTLADEDRKRDERDAQAARKKAADCRAKLDAMGVTD